MNRKQIKFLKAFIFIFTIVLALFLYYNQSRNTPDNVSTTKTVLDINNLPKYNGNPYVALNDNNPDFSKDELIANSYEKYADLDFLGRCGVANAVIGRDLMPTTKRESISSVKPSGWKSVKYKGIDGGSLYNRCHLIGFQLAGENANKKNLITGTRYLNTQGMLPFENMIADYVKETNNHVRYRVTPVFIGNELVARGVQMEAMSVEDNGKTIKFNVFCFNVQPNIEIEYSNGNSRKVK